MNFNMSKLFPNELGVRAYLFVLIGNMIDITYKEIWKHGSQMHVRKTVSLSDRYTFSLTPQTLANLFREQRFTYV